MSVALIELPQQYGNGSFWVNVSRITSVIHHFDGETQIDLAGYNHPIVIKEPVQKVLERLHAVGVKLSAMD